MPTNQPVTTWCLVLPSLPTLGYNFPHCLTADLRCQIIAGFQGEVEGMASSPIVCHIWSQDSKWLLFPEINF